MIRDDDGREAREFAQGPLSGVRVLVTRARHQSTALVEPLEALGAEVLVAPVIDTVDPDDWALADEAIARLSEYDWVILTSTNAVDRFLGRMDAQGVPRDALRELRIAVVGTATAEHLGENGLVADLVPADFRAEGLLEAFRAAGVGPGLRFLLPRAQKAREILPDALRADGASVDVVSVYRTVPAVPDASIVESLRAGDVDVVTFTSPSTVRHFVAWVASAGLDPDEVLSRVTAASIGPVTTAALRDRGYQVPVEAVPSTMSGLVASIVAHVASEGSRDR